MPLKASGLVQVPGRGDEVTWSFDRANPWRATIECLSALHEIDRDELLALMKHVAVQHFRAEGATSSLLALAKRKRGNEAAG